jgi:hypothetical protein
MDPTEPDPDLDPQNSLKKLHDMFSESKAARQAWCGSLLQLVMTVWPTCFEFELAGCGSPVLIAMAAWPTSNFKKVYPNGQYYLQQAVTPDQITQKNM